MLINGKVVRSLAGDNSGVLNWKGWDVSEFAGQNAQLRVVDQATGGWGHLTLDHVMLTDTAAVPRSDEETVNLVVNGKVVRTATGNDSETLDWASWNVKEFVGQQAQIKVVDNNRFGWGHVLADEFIASSTAATSRLQSYDWLDYGRDLYASVSFGNMPDNKRVMLGWMNNWDYANDIPTSPWRSAMALPREVNLTQTPEGPRLTQSAVKQIDKLAEKPSYSTKKIIPIAEGTIPLPAAASGQVQRVDITFAPGTAKKSGITVLGDGTSSTVIGYDATTEKLSVERATIAFTALHPGIRCRRRPRCRPEQGGQHHHADLPRPLISGGVRPGRSEDHHRPGIPQRRSRQDGPLRRRRDRPAQITHRDTAGEGDVPA